MGLLMPTISEAQPDSLVVAEVIADTVGCVAVATTDSVAKIKRKSPYRVRPLQVILPASMITFGFITVKSDWMENRNRELRYEVQEHVNHPHRLDDYTQY